jgi:hypothetical protein
MRTVRRSNTRGELRRDIENTPPRPTAAACARSPTRLGRAVLARDDEEELAVSWSSIPASSTTQSPASRAARLAGASVSRAPDCRDPGVTGVRRDGCIPVSTATRAHARASPRAVGWHSEFWAALSAAPAFVSVHDPRPLRPWAADASMRPRSTVGARAPAPPAPRADRFRRDSCC